MTEQEKARHGGRAKNESESKSKPTDQPEQPRRLPTPSEIKSRIDPHAFYTREIQNCPTLKAKGDGWTQNIRCPFPDHDDPNGSFGVNLKSGAYKCFGCGAEGGSKVDYVMNRDGLDLDGTREYFRDRYGIEAGAHAGGSRPGRSSPPTPAPKPASTPTPAARSRFPRRPWLPARRYTRHTATQRQPGRIPTRAAGP